MAVTWGAWEYSGGNGMRVGIEVSWATPTSGSSGVGANVDIWTENQYNYSGDTQTLNHSANLGADTAYTNNQASGTQTLRLNNRVYTHTYATSSYNTSPGNVTFTSTLSGAYNGITPSVSITTAIPARPSTPPSAPTSVTATPGNGFISVSFAAPTTTGSGGVSSYQKSSDNATWTTATNPFTISGTNGTSTTGYVRAVSLYGGAGPSASASATPRTVPDAPSVTATAGIRQITITFPEPGNGGSTITSYQYSLDNVNWSGAISSGHVITGLADNTTYTVYVRANNAAGSSGSGSGGATTPALPSTPTGLTANANTFGVIGLSWTASSGSGYTVTYTIARDGVTLGTTTGTTYNDSTVAPSVTYGYTVTPSTDVGTGGAASVSATSLGGIVHVWNGTNWTTQVGLVKVWNGSAWTLAQARVWNGTEWKYGI